MLLILTRGEDSQYFVLLAIPVLEAAFRLRLGSALAVVALAVALNFLGAYSLHSIGEYVEAGASSLIFVMVGVIVWLLINNLRERERELRLNLRELEQTREQPLAEERLATVGRLSAALAHEIRNPVAMISSSLATAQRPGLAETERKSSWSRYSGSLRWARAMRAHAIYLERSTSAHKELSPGYAVSPDW